VEGNRVRGVYPLSGHPLSHGRLCVRGWHIHELLQTEDRITQPLIKDGGHFRQVSYGEALNFVTERIRGIPGHEVAFLGSPRSSNEENYLLGKFARGVIKTNNLSLSSDAGQEESARVLLEGCGWPAMTGTLAELRQADFILVVGGDLTKQNPIIASEIHHAHRAGSFLATISPRKTQMARLSQLHLRPRPGTIFCLLQGLARILTDENKIDADYLSRFTANSQSFLKELKQVEIDQVVEATGIEKEQIVSLAKRLAESDSACAFYPTGVQSLDSRTIAALFNLFLLAGKIGRRGSGLNPVTGISNLLGSYDMGLSPVFLPGYAPSGDEREWEKLENFWQTKLDRWPGKNVDACLSEGESIKALFVVDHDEEIIRHVNRIKQLDLIVYFGAYGNPFASLAHIIFPRTSYAEGDGTYTNSERRVQLVKKKIDPPADVRPLWETLTSMARALGHDWNYRSTEDIMDEISQLVPYYSGLTYEKLTTRLGLKWPCDDLHPEGTDCLLAEEAGHSFQFIQADQPGERLAFDQEIEKDFPFKLVVGRSNYFWHQNSVMKRTFIPKREYNALLLLYPKGFVEISEEDASRLGIREKQPVRVVAESAEVRLAARISRDILPGMLYIPYFIDEMIPEFLHRQVADLEKNEEFFLPVRLEKAV
jgi:formate dehydrogenase major subunit